MKPGTYQIVIENECSAPEEHVIEVKADSEGNVIAFSLGGKNLITNEITDKLSNIKMLEVFINYLGSETMSEYRCVNALVLKRMTPIRN